MGRLVAGFGLLFALALVPLALAPNVVWMVIPGHFVFSLVVTLGAAHQGFVGHSRGVTGWGVLYMVTSIAIAASMGFGEETRLSWYWMVPWALMLVWGWIPAVTILFASMFAPARRRRLNAKAIRSRKKQADPYRSGKSVG